MGYIKDYEDYFKGIATAYKPIGHSEEESRFETMSQDAIISGARSNLNLTEYCLLLLKFEPKLIKNGTRQHRIEFTAAFEVVKDNARNDLDKTTIQDEALAMCEEIMAHIQNQNFQRSFPLGELQDDSVDFYEIEQVFDSCVGYGCEFKYFVTYNRASKIKTENWN